MRNTLITIPGKYQQIIFIICIGLCIVLPADPPVALLTGLLIALFTGNPFMRLNKKATTYLLQGSVVCLGFSINMEKALQAGKVGFAFTVGTIAMTLIAGYFIGKRLKIDRTTSFLISNGTAICGGSAIAAVAPILKANNEQISVSLGTIFILNSIALFIFPWIGHFIHLTDQQFGTWCAVAIQDTSSVVGAAGKFHKEVAGKFNEALQVATTVKLERALWIIPITLFTAYFRKSTGRIKIPYFIFLFIIAIIISTYFPVNYLIAGKTPYQYMYLLGKKGLVVTLFLIGSGLSVRTIKQVGWRPILQGVLLWLLIGSVSLFVIKEVIHS